MGGAAGRVVDLLFRELIDHDLMARLAVHAVSGSNRCKEDGVARVPVREGGAEGRLVPARRPPKSAYSWWLACDCNTKIKTYSTAMVRRYAELSLSC